MKQKGLVLFFLTFTFVYGILIGNYKVFPHGQIKYLHNIVSEYLEPVPRVYVEGSAVNVEAKARSVLSFIAYGDSPHVNENDVEKTIGVLSDAINDQNPSLIIHIGDTFGGQPCTDFMIDLQRDIMNRLNAPVLYTPGDNEWRDCRDETKGDAHNLERLAYIRKTYFSDKKTMGKNPVFIENQDSRKYPENARLMMRNVAFLTLHVVGSQNNFDPISKRNTLEYFERDTANIAWVTESFKKYENASAIVVAIHADMFDGSLENLKPPYYNFGMALFELSNKYGKPVLLLFGDSHTFMEFQPMPKKYPFINAIEVFGAPDLKAIEIAVVPSGKTPFHVVKVITDEKYRVGSSDPTSSLNEGDLFYNSNTNVLKFYNGSAWIVVSAVTSTTITGQSAETSIADDDLILISDTSASGGLKKMTKANFVTGLGSANAIADADGDTKIQVEESSDEDKIRFDSGGSERAVLDSNGIALSTNGGSFIHHNTIANDTTLANQNMLLVGNVAITGTLTIGTNSTVVVI